MNLSVDEINIKANAQIRAQLTVKERFKFYKISGLNVRGSSDFSTKEITHTELSAAQREII